MPIPISDGTTTLRSLRAFFDAHAFDTEGPYADLFAVLLSTAKHAIDAAVWQQDRIDQLAGELALVKQESAALCDNSARVNEALRKLNHNYKDTTTAAVCGECHRHRYHHHISSHSAKDATNGYRSENYALGNHGPPPAELSPSLRRLSDEVAQARLRLHMCEESLSAHIGSAAAVCGYHEGRRTLTTASAVDHRQQHGNRIRALEDSHEAVLGRLAQLQATADKEKEKRQVPVAAVACRESQQQQEEASWRAVTALDERTSELAFAVQRIEEQLRRVAARLHSSGGGVSVREQSPEAVARGNDNSGGRVQFTEDDFTLPSPSPRSSVGRSGIGKSSSAPATAAAAMRSNKNSNVYNVIKEDSGDGSSSSSAADAMWGEWVRVIQLVRGRVASDAVRQQQRPQQQHASSLPPPVLSSGHASAAAMELFVLVRQIIDATTTTINTNDNSNAAAFGSGGSGGTDALLADRLDSLAGRVEVLEVYAPHTYAIAARPPLLGIELGADATTTTPTEKEAAAAHGHDNKDSGVLVTRIFAGLAADEAGISPGDRILSVGGAAVVSRAEVYVALRERAQAHRARCQLIMENALVTAAFPPSSLSSLRSPSRFEWPSPSRASVAAAAAPNDNNDTGPCGLLPPMDIPLTVGRDGAARHLLISVPAGVCSTQYS